MVGVTAVGRVAVILAVLAIPRVVSRSLLHAITIIVVSATSALAAVTILVVGVTAVGRVAVILAALAIPRVVSRSLLYVVPLIATFAVPTSVVRSAIAFVIALVVASYNNR